MPRLESQIDVRSERYASQRSEMLERVAQLRSYEEKSFAFEHLPLSDAADARASGDSIVAPMAGRIVEIQVADGASIEKGQVLIILEAMKMQLELTAPRDAPGAKILVAVGDQVQNKQLLAELKEKS